MFVDYVDVSADASLASFDWLMGPAGDYGAAVAAEALKPVPAAEPGKSIAPAAPGTTKGEQGFFASVGEGLKNLYTGIGAWFADPSQTSPAGRLAEGMGSGAAAAGAGVGQGAAAAGAGVGSGMGWGIPVALGAGVLVLGVVLLVKLPGAR